MYSMSEIAASSLKSLLGERILRCFLCDISSWGAFDSKFAEPFWEE